MLLSMSQPRPRLLPRICSALRHSPLVYAERFTGRAIRHFLLAAALLLFSAPFAFSLDPSLDISQYAHTAWKVRDGFTKGAILAMAQTPDGYLWLGTESGLYRFDGVRAVLWQPPAGEQVPSDNIRSLLVSRDGTLWIGTSKGLASWKEGKLTKYSQVAGQLVFGLFQDRAGTVWFGTSLPGRVCAIQSGIPECYGASLFGPALLGIYEDRESNLWLSAATGVWRWRPGSPEQYKFPRGTIEVDSLIEDANGTLLLATNDGLKQVVDGKLQSYSLPGTKGTFRPVRLLQSSDGSLWIGSNQGLLHVHEDAVDTFGVVNGLSGDAIMTIFEDREGSVWVATVSGLDRFRDYAIATLSQAQGLSQSFATSVQATADGSIWILTLSGLNRWKNGKVTVFGRPDVQSKVVSPTDRQVGMVTRGLPHAPLSLGQDDRGRLLVSTQDDVFCIEGSRFVRVPGIPGGNGIVTDHAGGLWVSSHTGLFHWTERNIFGPTPWSLFKVEVTGTKAMLPTASLGGVWLAFYPEGLVYFKDGKVRDSYSASDGLGEGVVNDLRFGARGTLWAATEGGLSRIRDGHITTLSRKNGLPCDPAHWSIEDDDHAVWVYMSCGLVRIARSELDSWVSDPKHVIQTTVFGASDGVGSVPTQWGNAPHVTKSADGRIWFLPRDGVSVIDPRRLPYNKMPPPVHIEQVTADGKVYDAANGVQLPRLARYVDIDYTALSLVVPEKVRFRVKLEGEDRDWRELVNVRRVSYTNLGPKHYRFLVKACNNSGVWNEEGAALDFVIPPAWYQTYWFFAACVAAFLALFWALYQYRLHQLAQQFNMRLEERVGERTRIARDLHDTLLQSFHGILLFLQSGIHLMPEHPAEGMKTLKKAAEQAERAIIEGREAVQGLRASTVERNDLALAIKTLGGELAAADSNSQRAEFNVQVEGIPRELHPILRDEVYRIAGEAMRNAFRHADAKQIEVEIRYDERQLRLRVRDDGKGIDPKLLSHDGREGHFGLRGMRERAKLIGGKLTVWSELDSGTEVELSLPANRAYTAPGDGQRSWLMEKLAKFSGKDSELKS